MAPRQIWGLGMGRKGQQRNCELGARAGHSAWPSCALCLHPAGERGGGRKGRGGRDGGQRKRGAGTTHGTDELSPVASPPGWLRRPAMRCTRRRHVLQPSPSSWRGDTCCWQPASSAHTRTSLATGRGWLRLQRGSSHRPGR